MMCQIGVERNSGKFDQMKTYMLFIIYAKDPECLELALHFYLGKQQSSV